MPKHVNAGKTVAEILKGKRGSIKDAPLDEGSPSWDDILDLDLGRVEATRHSWRAWVQDVQEAPRSEEV